MNLLTDPIATNIVILTPKDIVKRYNLNYKLVCEILNQRGCPLITGGTDSRGRSTGKHYRIEKSAFEDFLRRKST